MRLYSSRVLDFDWNRNGEVLSIIDDQTNHVYTWEASSFASNQIPTNLR